MGNARMPRVSRPAGRKNSKARSLPSTFPPCPLAQATIAPPEGEVKRPGRAMTRGGTQKGGDPSRTLPSWRRSRARPEPERRREADDGERSGSVGARECRDERLVRRRSPLRRRARGLRGWRGDHEPEPLEQDPQALALRVHPHDPPPAAAARALKDVQDEHPAQQRRPRRPLSWRTPGPGRRLRPRRRPLAWHHRRGSTPRNDRRPPRRGRPENPLKAKRMKSTGRNQDRNLLDQLQRIQQDAASVSDRPERDEVSSDRPKGRLC